ncbi:MAG: SpoIIE family protein phosphatase, partial [Flammeovirgaceae bacterium]
LFYLNQERSEVGYLKGSPQAIGGMKQKIQHYHEREIFLKKGDIIYLTSDGLMAQGDANVGKIGTNGFKKFVKEHADKPLLEQKEALQVLLKEYQSDQAQRDDILVFAIKL